MPPSNTKNPPIEVTPPDIRAYARGNTGIDYVTSLDSEVKLGLPPFRADIAIKIKRK